MFSFCFGFVFFLSLITFFIQLSPHIYQRAKKGVRGTQTWQGLLFPMVEVVERFRLLLILAKNRPDDTENMAISIQGIFGSNNLPITLSSMDSVKPQCFPRNYKRNKIGIKQLIKRAALKAAAVHPFSKTTVLILQNNVTIHKKLPLSLQTTGTWRALTGFPLLTRVTFLHAEQRRPSKRRH